eukprot:663087-Prorocentrum_minimum.AAC.1
MHAYRRLEMLQERKTEKKGCGFPLGLDTDIKPLLSHSATGEFDNSPPEYLRTPKKCPPTSQKSAR